MLIKGKPRRKTTLFRVLSVRGPWQGRSADTGRQEGHSCRKALHSHRHAGGAVSYPSRRRNIHGRNHQVLEDVGLGEFVNRFDVQPTEYDPFRRRRLVLQEPCFMCRITCSLMKQRRYGRVRRRTVQHALERMKITPLFPSATAHPGEIP